MRFGSLQLLGKTNSKRLFNIAAYHSRHSLTWSWILSINFDGIWRYPPPPLATRKGLRFDFHPYRTNVGLQWVLTAPFVCVQWHRQREMWFRDMYARARDREDALESANRKLRRELAKARSLALVEPEGPVQ